MPVFSVALDLWRVPGCSTSPRTSTTSWMLQLFVLAAGFDLDSHFLTSPTSVQISAKAQLTDKDHTYLDADILSLI
jgi:hypothetical protein